MQVRKLAVAGAFEFSPQVHADDRGVFVSPYQESVFVDTIGTRLFSVAQASVSLSRRGVVRGIHYTSTPPGTAKYVHCGHGRALDVVVDLRVGSPTFGVWDTVLLDQERHRATYLPVGVGHAFIALEPDTAMCYLLSESYVPHIELAVSVLDPALGLPIPADIEPVLSERDRQAPTLAQAQAAQLLPDYATCLQIEARAIAAGAAAASP